MIEVHPLLFFLGCSIWGISIGSAITYAIIKSGSREHY